MFLYIERMRENNRTNKIQDKKTIQIQTDTEQKTDKRIYQGQRHKDMRKG